MTDPWRYQCPFCGSHTFYPRIRKGKGRPPKNPDDRYRCGRCPETFDEPFDKKGATA